MVAIARAVAGPGTSEATPVAATLCQPSPYDLKVRCSLSKSLVRGTAQRSRGGAYRALIPRGAKFTPAYPFCPIFGSVPALIRAMFSR